MNWWEMLAVLAAGAFGVGSLASSNAAAAQAAPADDQTLLARCVSAAITTELDITTLTTFSVKLHAAGYATYAAAVDERITRVRAMMIPQTRFTITDIFAESSS